MLDERVGALDHGEHGPAGPECHGGMEWGFLHDELDEDGVRGGGVGDAEEGGAKEACGELDEFGWGAGEVEARGGRVREGAEDQGGVGLLAEDGGGGEVFNEGDEVVDSRVDARGGCAASGSGGCAASRSRGSSSNEGAAWGSRGSDCKDRDSCLRGARGRRRGPGVWGAGEKSRGKGGGPDVGGDVNATSAEVPAKPGI